MKLTSQQKSLNNNDISYEEFKAAIDIKSKIVFAGEGIFFYWKQFINVIKFPCNNLLQRMGKNEVRNHLSP